MSEPAKSARPSRVLQALIIVADFGFVVQWIWGRSSVNGLELLALGFGLGALLYAWSGDEWRLFAVVALALITVSGWDSFSFSVPHSAMGWYHRVLALFNVLWPPYYLVKIMRDA